MKTKIKPFIAICVLGTSLMACQTSPGTGNQAVGTKTEVMASDTAKRILVRYKCDQGKEIVVEYLIYQNKAIVRPDAGKPEKIIMNQVISGSGARYSDGKLVWWNKGNTGFLMEAAGAERIITDNCVEFSRVE